jgi:hypothetical protein
MTQSYRDASAFAAKRLHIAAQGFSPGLCGTRNRPESGGRGASLALRVLFHHRAQNRVPLSGHLLLPPDPGLTPWAVLSSRCAAKTDAPNRPLLLKYHIYPVDFVNKSQ